MIQEKEPKYLPPTRIPNLRRTSSLDFDLARRIAQALDYQLEYEKSLTQTLNYYEIEEKSFMKRSGSQMNLIQPDQIQQAETLEKQKRDNILNVMSNYEAKLLTISKICRLARQGDIPESENVKLLLESVRRVSYLYMNSIL